MLTHNESQRNHSVDSAAPHRIPAIKTLVARAAPHRDAAADVAGGGVGLHFGALLAEGVHDDGEAEVGHDLGLGLLRLRRGGAGDLLLEPGAVVERLGVAGEVAGGAAVGAGSICRGGGGPAVLRTAANG